MIQEEIEAFEVLDPIGAEITCPIIQLGGYVPPLSLRFVNSNDEVVKNFDGVVRLSIWFHIKKFICMLDKSRS